MTRLEDWAERILVQAESGLGGKHQAQLTLERLLTELEPEAQGSLIVRLVAASAQPTGPWAGAMTEILQVTPPESLIPRVFDRQFGCAEISRRQLEVLFNRQNSMAYPSPILSDPRDAAAAFAVAGSQLRSELALILLDESLGQLIPGGESNYHQAAASLICGDPVVARRLADHLSRNPEISWEIYSAEDSVALEQLQSALAELDAAEPAAAEVVRRVEAVLGMARAAAVIEQRLAERRSLVASTGWQGPAAENGGEILEVLETLAYPPRRRIVDQVAHRYGIRPALLAGTACAASGLVQASQPRAAGNPLGMPLLAASEGDREVGAAVLRAAASYLSEQGLPAAERSQRIRFEEGENDFAAAIEATAVVAAMFSHAQDGGSEATEMALVWGAIRGGIVELLAGRAGGGEGRLAEFGIAAARELPVELRITLEGYLAEPYFEHFLS